MLSSNFKNQKAGHHRPVRETSFERRLAGGPMVAPDPACWLGRLYEPNYTSTQLSSATSIFLRRLAGGPMVWAWHCMLTGQALRTLQVLNIAICYKYISKTINWQANGGLTLHTDWAGFKNPTSTQCCHLLQVIFLRRLAGRPMVAWQCVLTGQALWIPKIQVLSFHLLQVYFQDMKAVQCTVSTLVSKHAPKTPSDILLNKW